MVNQDEAFMLEALLEADNAERIGEVPVGAVLVHDNAIIARAHNKPIATCDPTMHAEVNVLRLGGKVLQNYRLIDTTLFVTLEPCVMCMGAIIHARVARVVFGAFDPKTGACGSVFSLHDEPRLNHRLTVRGGVLEAESRHKLQSFFTKRR